MELFIKRVQEVFNSEYFLIERIYDIGDKYLFFIVSKEHKGRDDIMDPWYTVDKKTKKINGFIVHENLDTFRKAMGSKPVYTA